jgi:hypothetical protein
MIVLFPSIEKGDWEKRSVVSQVVPSIKKEIAIYQQVRGDT